MNTITIIGIIASTFTGISLLPQLIKLLKDKKAGDISLLMLATLLAGLVLWIFYGTLLHDKIIIIANSVSLFLNILIMSINIYYKKTQRV